jgi:hypothetical protein
MHDHTGVVFREPSYPTYRLGPPLFSQAPRAERGSCSRWRGQEGVGPGQRHRIRGPRGHGGGRLPGADAPESAGRTGKGGSRSRSSGNRNERLLPAKKRGGAEPGIQGSAKRTRGFLGSPGHRVWTHGSWRWRLTGVDADCLLRGCE